VLGICSFWAAKSAPEGADAQTVALGTDSREGNAERQRDGVLIFLINAIFAAGRPVSRCARLAANASPSRWGRASFSAGDRSRSWG